MRLGLTARRRARPTVRVKARAQGRLRLIAIEARARATFVRHGVVVLAVSYEFVWRAAFSVVGLHWQVGGAGRWQN